MSELLVFGVAAMVVLGYGFIRAAEHAGKASAHAERARLEELAEKTRSEEQRQAMKRQLEKIDWDIIVEFMAEHSKDHKPLAGFAKDSTPSPRRSAMLHFSVLMFIVLTLFIYAIAASSGAAASAP